MFICHTFRAGPGVRWETPVALIRGFINLPGAAGQVAFCQDLYIPVEMRFYIFGSERYSGRVRLYLSGFPE